MSSFPNSQPIGRAQHDAVQSGLQRYVSGWDTSVEMEMPPGLSGEVLEL